MPGVFAPQPLSLLDPGRWWAYQSATRGCRTYDLYGAWRKAMRREPQPADPHFEWEPCSQRVLGRANDRRRLDAWKRRERLLAAVRPFWAEWVARRPRKPGRPAVLRPLRELLGELAAAEGGPAGLFGSVTGRDLRWLSARLNSPGTGVEVDSGRRPGE